MNSFFQTLSNLPSPVLLAMVFLFALTVGSFLNVVIYRLPIILEREWRIQAREILELEPVEEAPFTLTIPRSRCRDCGRMIRAWENIPVISYLLMGGKCRGCHSKISIFYPIVEFLTAALVTFVFWHFGSNWQGLCAVFFVFALIPLTGIDLKTQLLPDIITLPLMWVGILISFWQVFIPLPVAVAGAMVSYSFLWIMAKVFEILLKKEAKGMGDAKLLAAIFAWVHIEMLPIMLLMTCVFGIIVEAIKAFVTRSKFFGNPFPFGPYLAAGGLITLLYGKDIMAWYVPMLLAQ